jgi:hypothetical protein
MGIFKNLLKKEKSSCCSVKIEEVIEQNAENEAKNEQNGDSGCGK